MFALVSQSFAQKFSYNMMTSMYSLQNKKGKTICADCYVDVKSFKDGKAWVKDTSGSFHSRENTNRGFDDYPRYEYALWGMIDKNGKWIIKPCYNKLDTFINGVSLMGKHHYKYVWVKDSSYYTIHVDSFKGIEKDSNYRYVREFEFSIHWGTVSEKGKEIVPVIYPELYRYIDGYALAAMGIRTNNIIKNDTQTRYVLLDPKGNIYKRFYHQEILPQYAITTSEYYTNSYEGLFTNINYKKVPPLYSYMDLKEGAGYYGLLDSKGNELIPPYTFTNKQQTVVMVMDDPNDPYNAHDTALTVYNRPPFFYDSLSGQLFYKFQNEKTNSSIIANEKGEILYKSNNTDFFNSFPSNNTYINFVRKNGDYEINFPRPISEKYDTVTKYFDQFKPFPNMEISPFVQMDSDSPFNNITHQLYITHRDTLFGLLNKNLKEIIPLKYTNQMQRMDDEYMFDPMYLYTTPTILYIKPTNQYTFSAKNISTDHWEVIIISGEGEIVANIPDCTYIIWEPVKLMYSITLVGGVNKLCDTKGSIK